MHGGFFVSLKMKNFQNRYAAVIENGSWGPVSGRLMKSYLENMKNITICEDMVTIRSVMKRQMDRHWKNWQKRL